MKTTLVAAALIALFALSPTSAWAHCDTIDGPVVKAAASALEQGKIDPVLRWVRKDDEKEVREAFTRALQVRALNANAKKLADQYFFETVVRLHRAGEGEPYTGLKPAGTPIDPVILEADRALETGNVDNLKQHLTAQLARAIETRFAEALETQKEAGTSIEAGRQAVAAYVEFVHYLEQLEQPGAHHGAEKEREADASRH